MARIVETATGTDREGRGRPGHPRPDRERAAQRPLRDGRGAVPDRAVAGHPRAARRVPADRRPAREDGGRPVRPVHPRLPGRLRRRHRGGRRPAHSDPYSCGAAISHANDWLVVVPIFHEGRVVGWASMFGHMSDVGGKTPSSMPTDATHHLRGGRGHPALQAVRSGRAQRGRAADHPQPGARCPTGTGPTSTAWSPPAAPPPAGWQEMCARFGTGTYLSALDALLQRNYDAMKVLLPMVFEEGRTLSFTDYICDDGVGYGPYELKLSLTRTGDKVHLDFTGSSPQAVGPINYYINENLTRMFFGIYMITVADPQILWNDGFYPLVDVTIPDGSYWKPKHPGRAERPQPRHRPGLRPVRRAARADQPGAAQRRRVLLVAALHVLRQLLRRRAEGRVVPAVLDRLRRHPRPAARRRARTGTRCGRASSTSPASSWSPTTRCGSRSGRPSPTPAAPGLHRGGNGVDVAYVFLEPGTIAIHDDRWLTYPWGVNGGSPGARGTQVGRPRRRHPRGAAQQVPRRPGRARATCCTSSPGAAAAGATRWSATRRWSRWRCAAGWSPPRAPGGTASSSDDRGTLDDDATDGPAGADARRPAGRAAGLRHGPADRGAAGALRGGDRPARAEAARVGVSRPGPAPRPARLGVLGPAWAGGRGPRSSSSTWCAPTPTRTARSGCRSPGPAVDARRRRWWTRPGRRGRPVVWTAVRYAAGLADGGLFVRKVPALACLRRGRAGRLGRAHPGPGAGRAGGGQAVRLGVLRHLAGADAARPPGWTRWCSPASRRRAACGPPRWTRSTPASARRWCATPAPTARPAVHDANLADLDAKYADVVGLAGGAGPPAVGRTRAEDERGDPALPPSGPDGPEVLLGHMGGPFWAKKDDGAWSIPKGEHDADEEPLAVARREFEEELGLARARRRPRAARRGPGDQRQGAHRAGPPRATWTRPRPGATPSSSSGRRAPGGCRSSPRSTGRPGSAVARRGRSCSRARCRSSTGCGSCWPRSTPDGVFFGAEPGSRGVDGVSVRIASSTPRSSNG